MADRIVVMDEGVIQQIGTPPEVYNHPVNRFVAGFIGSPAMNMLDGEIRQDGSELVIVGDGFELPVPRAFHESLEGAASRNVVAGLRPEHFSSTGARYSGGATAPVQLTVDVAEYVGSNQFLAARIGEQRISVSVEAGPEHGRMESGTYYFETERLYLFEKETGLALKPTARAGTF